MDAAALSQLSRDELLEESVRLGAAVRTLRHGWATIASPRVPTCIFTTCPPFHAPARFQLEKERKISAAVTDELRRTKENALAVVRSMMLHSMPTVCLGSQPHLAQCCKTTPMHAPIPHHSKIKLSRRRRRSPTG